MQEHDKKNNGDMENLFGRDAFSRQDETDDGIFYETDRFVSHLDSTALKTVEHVIGSLIHEERPHVLDLMAGWDSHVPDTLDPERLVGLGLNKNELAGNAKLTEHVIHDLNRDPKLPFPDDAFDAVVNTVSVDYLVKPFDVFGEVGRILKPGGIFLVIFSNRMFEPKAVNIWRRSGEEERVLLVEEYFEHSELFEESRVFVSRGKPRPEDDKYAHLGIPSDPVYAVYAEKKGGAPGRKPRRVSEVAGGESFDPEEVHRRKTRIKDTHECPHCGKKMRKWAVSQTPFTEWDTEFMYICFNNRCPYYLKGWDAMQNQGNPGMSYRCMYNPDNDRCMPVPVPHRNALREGIVD
jgi:SAM-dependent methyltransferase